MKVSVALLLLGCLAGALASMQSCMLDVRTSRDSMIAALKKYNETQNTNFLIEDVAKLTKTIPTVMEDCGDERAADSFRKALPNVCVDDLEKASKMGVKLLNETDNEAKFAMDMLLLERLFDKKIKKDCPSFQNVTLRQIMDKGQCAQSSYDLSLALQKFLGDLERGEGNKAVDDFVTLLSQLPDTLDKCGQTDLADKIRRDLPKECLSSIDAFGKVLVEVEFHYDHLEWLYKNLRRVIIAYKQVTYTCPIFG